MNTLALYCRASNEDGNLEESATIQNQRDLLMHFVKDKPEFENWNILEFQDDGWSGTTFERPGVQSLLQKAGSDIQCIIVKDFSRFGRNLIEVGNYLDQVFPFLGVRFIAVNENYDSQNNTGRTIGLDVSLKAMVYEMYSRDLSKKITSVKEAQMKKGRYIGSFAFYGYQKSKDTKSGLTVDIDAAFVVQRIFSLAADGMKPVTIAVLLNREGIMPPLTYRRVKYPKERFQCPSGTRQNVWTQKGISAILRDERYTGCLISKKKIRVDISTTKMKQLNQAQWIRVENALEAIVSKSMYEKAQKVLLPNRQGRGLPQARELFCGMLKCRCCGRALEKIPCKAPYFRCPIGQCLPDSSCAHVQIAKAELEQMLIVFLQLQLQTFLQTKPSAKDAVASQEMELFVQLRQADKNLEKRKLEQIILFERFADGRVDRQTFINKKQELVKHRQALEKHKKSLTEQLQNGKQPWDDSLQNDLGIKKLTSKLLTEFAERIEISPDNVACIKWKFKDCFLCRS